MEEKMTLQERVKKSNEENLKLLDKFNVCAHHVVCLDYIYCVLWYVKRLKDPVIWFYQKNSQKEKKQALDKSTSKDGYQKFMDQHLILKYVLGTGF